MDAKQVRDAVTLIDAACRRISELRKRRIGNRTHQQFSDDLGALNRLITSKPSAEQGQYLAQKALWFNHDHMLNELGNLQAIMQAIQRCLEDEGVRAEIEQSGYSLDKTIRHVEQSQDWIARFRSTVDAHEQLLAQGLAGKPIAMQDLDDLENRLVRFDDWENKVVQLGQATVSRIMPYTPTIESKPLSFARRIAAALVLSLASTVFGAFATPAYAQQETKQQQTVTKADELTDKNIEDLMKYETVEKILNENEIIKGAKVEYVKYDAAKKTTNYDELVFQKHLKPEERKPVMVLFYHNKDPPDALQKRISPRSAIVIKKLAERYTDEIKFICFNVDVDPVFAKNNYEWFNKELDVKSIPSFAMYSKFDILQKETATNNDGKIKRIDTLRKGPTNNTDINILVKNLSTWAKYNALSNTAEEKGYTYRYNNTFDVSKIEIKK